MMLTHCGNNVRNRYSGCVFSVKDIVPVPLKTSRTREDIGKQFRANDFEYSKTYDLDCPIFLPNQFRRIKIVMKDLGTVRRLDAFDCLPENFLNLTGR